VAISGHRTWAEQDELYERGVTLARGGESNHNFGIAADFAVFRGKVYLDDSKPELARRVHAACAAHAKDCGLEWGGDWKRFVDPPHYELATGLTLAAKCKLYKERGSVL
jgi:peptidoglycan L-alanyl-D-glutamate endopeptidase CwlK